MTYFQGRAKRKFTGGKYKKLRSKRRSEIGREPSLTRIGTIKNSVLRVRGGNTKVMLMRAEYANVYIPAEKKTIKVKIKTVKENPANQHYVQRNIINKGVIIETENGNARVTSRPGQDGVVNAILL